MTRRAPSFPPHRHLGWLMLLVCVLIARGVGADGWMPGTTASGGFAIVACDGMQPDDAMPMAKGMAMPHGTSHHMPDKKPSSSHPCAFAGIGLASAPPPPVAIGVPLSPYTQIAPLAVAVIAPGRGLAAPPPPATGPPAFA